MDTWMYLSDLAPQGQILNLTTGQIRSIMSSAVKGKAPSGLRRTLLKELPGGMFQELPEVVPLTEENVSDLEDAYTQPNNWNYDWPHLPTETQVPADAEAMIRERLTAMMSHHPYDFAITALQRRYLMYFTDGNWKSQQAFERLIPRPGSTPFKRNWELRPRYAHYWDSMMRDAKAPFPKEQESLYGGLVPCLYVGPAWTVRFTIDGQDPLLERCRVYVKDDGTFICSDWCQRHDYSSYGSGGINLQMGIYSFDGWVTGPCLAYNESHNGIAIKSTTVKRAAVRDLLAKAPAPVVVPKFEDSFKKAQDLIAKCTPAVTTPVATVVSVDAGPITADVLAEAQAVADALLPEAEARLAASAPTIVADGLIAEDHVPCSWTEQGWRVARVRVHPDDLSSTTGYVFAYRHDIVNGMDTVAARLCYRGPGYKTITEAGWKDVEAQEVRHFSIAPDGRLLYQAEGSSPEALNTTWWLNSAAVGYRDGLLRSDRGQAVARPEEVSA